MLKNFMLIGLIAMVLIFNLFLPTESASSNISQGAWLGEWPDSNKNNIQAFNEMTQSHAKIIHTFVNTNHQFKDYSNVMNYVDSQNAVNLLTLEPNGLSTEDINNGQLDSYFQALAIDMKNWKKEIWLRFMHEMNGNWYTWSIGDSKVNTNESYIKAYQRVVNIFKTNNAQNVKWIYCVNSDNVGKGSSFLGAYPGGNYVDFVAIDGYNWGTSQSWSQWRSFKEIFNPSYTEVKKLNHPILITEWASSELGGDKGSWIKDAFYQMEQGGFDIEAAIWFNENKETDWRIESSENSLRGYLR
ncbi:glycoside hydrolase family 26 protein [Niallia sp. 03091]|uniref:glycoside hydrolase family 26 protein n=1 Tax=unclassified Niallia TaxID=2837522 RepID=UPI004044E274